MSLQRLSSALVASVFAVSVPAQKPAAHWAFVPPQRPVVPRVEDGERWVRNPIDAFVLARLRAEGISPSRATDRATLLRRVSLDLIGLPPTPQELERFLSDRGEGAYRRAVDRLLASPHYGERWARHWLDAARYADSHGYSIDSPRSIWPYRDWVINALNRDLGFDRFAIEQLAGDLLPGANREQRIATGFHRNTMINQEGGVDKEEFRVEAVKDRVNTTATVFLGLTMACAQCHDHKYDPLGQEEYYRLFAFFNNDDEKTLEVRSPGEDFGRQRAGGWLKTVKKKRKPRVPTTMVLSARAKPRASHVHVRGDFTRKGKQVEPGVPAILHSLRRRENLTRLDLARWIADPDNPLTARVTVNRIWQRYFGRGLVETENDFGAQGSRPTHPRLLDWLATELVRRRWSLKAIHRLIVNSATYRQSSRRREDLDRVDARNRWLARQTRLRLDAEIIRDSALAASGLLSRKVGGPSVFPPQPDGVMDLGQQNRKWRVSQGEDRYRRGLYTFFWRATPHPTLTVFDAPAAMEACTRRIRSNTPLQALTLLNDQAFFEFAQALARRLLAVETRADAERVRVGFRLCLSREPTVAELATLLDLLAEHRTELAASPADAPKIAGGKGDLETAAWTLVARVLLNLDEFITRG